ncbi:hypothetical protein Tco_0164239 [Tanacetum coccineum]
MESLNSNSQERAVSVATNARQSKGKLHGIFPTTSFTSPEFHRHQCYLNGSTRKKQLDKEEFQETGYMDAFRKSIDERAQHKREYDSRVNKRHMQSKKGKVDSSKALDASLVVTECSGTKSDKQDTSGSLGNYITHAMDADIRPVNDQEPFAKVQLTTQHNVLANEKQHSVL